MTVPSVQSTVLNGKLGVKPPGGAELHAYLGCCSAGAVNTPTRHSRTDDAISIYSSGPGVELAIAGTDRWDESADFVMVGMNATTPGSYGSIDVSGFTGSAAVEIDATTHPDDDADVLIEFIDGGTLGTPGATYQWSLSTGAEAGDSPVTALGTAHSITLPIGGGIKFDLGAIITGSTDATSSGLYGGSSTLDGETLILTQPGGSPLTLMLDKTTNVATEAALLAAIHAEWPLITATVVSTHLVLTAVGGPIVVGAGTANTHLGLTAGTVNGTIEAGDVVRIQAIAPQWGNTDLSNALASLQTTHHDWKAAWLAGPVNAAAAGVIKAFEATLEAQTGKSRKVYFSLRVPSSGESEPTYLTAMTNDFASFAEPKTLAFYAAARCQSARTGRPYVKRRQTIFAVAGLSARLPLRIDMSQRVDATPQGLPGVSLYDSNGNNIEHDEMLNPGADDARFCALRTWPDKENLVYVNNPTTLEAPGGDFHLDQFVRILCVFCDTARSTLNDELSRDLDLNLKDNGPNKAGAPTEAECQRIDGSVLEAEAVELAGQVSGLEFAVHRDDPILSSQTIHADGGIIFKGYPKQIDFTVAAINPAAAA